MKKLNQSALAILFAFVSLQMTGQTKKELKIFKEVYSATLNDYETKPSNFILVNNSVNKKINETDYTTYMDYFSIAARKGHPAKFLLDSSWTSFFKDVEVKRKLLSSFVLPKINSIHYIRTVGRDSISKAFRNDAFNWSSFYNTFGNVKGWIELSNVMLSTNKKKALVELNYQGDSKTGVGYIYFLEKKGKKWIVVNSMQTWIS